MIPDVAFYFLFLMLHGLMINISGKFCNWILDILHLFVWQTDIDNLIKNLKSIVKPQHHESVKWKCLLCSHKSELDSNWSTDPQCELISSNNKIVLKDLQYYSTHILSDTISYLLYTSHIGNMVEYKLFSKKDISCKYDSNYTNVGH